MAEITEPRTLTAAEQAWFDANLLPGLAGSAPGAALTSVLTLLDAGTPHRLGALTLSTVAALGLGIGRRATVAGPTLAGDGTPATTGDLLTLQAPGRYQIDLEGIFTTTDTMAGYVMNVNAPGGGIVEVPPASGGHILGMGTGTLRVAISICVDVTTPGPIQLGIAAQTTNPAASADFTAAAVYRALV